MKLSESRSDGSDSLQPHELHGILQARILEWVASPFSRGSFQPRDCTQVSRIAGENDTEISHHRVVFYQSLVVLFLGFVCLYFVWLISNFSHCFSSLFVFCLFCCSFRLLSGKEMMVILITIAWIYMVLSGLHIYYCAFLWGSKVGNAISANEESGTLKLRKLPKSQNKWQNQHLNIGFLILNVVFFSNASPRRIHWKQV